MPDIGEGTRDITLASWDGEPVLVTPGEAWSVRDGKWVEIDSAEASMNARPLSSEDFARKFPSLPPIPKEALTSGGSSASTGSHSGGDWTPDAPPLAPAE